MLIISVVIKNSQKHHKYYEFCYYADYFSLGCMYNIMNQEKRYHETDFTRIIHLPSCSQRQFKLTVRKLDFVNNSISNLLFACLYGKKVSF